ncbi:MAG: hypothetical protein IT347_11405 [Candidatus Eisenbacteria bacterium]|nr:hypothetical protein [Candidatus Eisenbacteria bacterium]
MNGPMRVGFVGPIALAGALLAAALVLVAGSVQAQGEGRAWRMKAGGGERSGGGEARWKGDGGRVRGGGPGWSGTRGQGGGDVRWKGDGGRVWNGGGTHRDWVSRGRGHDHGGFDGWQHPRGTSRYYRGRAWYPRTSYYYRHPRPRAYFSVGIGLPYYCPIRYRRVVVRQPVVSRYEDGISVDNLPPAGCYYWDPYCDREFPDLDSYTDHVDRASHRQTIEIRDRDRGGYVRTLVLDDGFWVVQG